MNQEPYCLLIGNSRWHWAIKKASSWEYSHSVPTPERITSLDTDSLIAWASVGNIPSQISLDRHKRITTKDIPLGNSPSWLGVDRALGAWSALQKASKSDLNPNGIIIIDAGTILSLTKIDKNGDFEGGQLIAGLSLQLSLMADGTENLTQPFVRVIPKNLFPSLTHEAMLRGSIQGLKGTIIEAHKVSRSSIWMCGGDAPILIEALKKEKLEISYHPNLVLEGMVKIIS